MLPFQNLSPRPVEDSPVKSLLQNFVQNTSLLGVQHFLRQRSFVWLAAYLLCIAMSIVQSWSVTLTFFEQLSYQTITLTSKKLMPFPSVTLCSNIVLRQDFDFSVIPNFNASAYNELRGSCSKSKIESGKWDEIISSNNNAAQHYLRSLNNSYRTSLGVNLTEYVTACNYGGRKCNFSDPNEVYIFNNAYYGNCFTFNPALEENSGKLADTHDMLHLVVQLDSRGYWQVPYDHPTATLLIHAPGTAPTLKLTETEHLSGKMAIRDLVLSETIAFKKRSSSFPSCVDVNDLAYRQRSRYYTEQSPYLYSLEACMQSCEQDRVGEQCRTINPLLPLQSEEYERGKEPKFSFGCKLNESLNMEECNCPNTCTRIDYRIVRQNIDFYNFPCQNNRKAPPIDSHGCSRHTNDTEEAQDEGTKAAVFVSFQSNIYDKVEEKLSCNLSEYLGILGGNMSLWTGLCIISLLELVELGIGVTIAAARNNKTKN